MTGRHWFGLGLLATLAALGIGLSITASETTSTAQPPPTIRTSVSISSSPNSPASTGISSPNPEDSAIPPSLTPSGPSDGVTPTPMAPMHYTVVVNDSLSVIADKLNVTTDALYQANLATVGSDWSLIRPGQVLVVPSGD